MKISAAVALGFPMEISIFDVEAHRQAHFGVGGKLLSVRVFFCRSAELEDDRVFAFDHFGAQFDFHRAAVAGAGDKIPDGGRSGSNEARLLKSSGERKPSAFTQTRRRLTKMWRSTGKSGFKFAPRTQSYLELMRPKSTQIRAMPPRPFVSRTRSLECGVRSAERGVGGQKTNRGGNILRRGGVTLQNQFGVRPPLSRGAKQATWTLPAGMD